MPSFRTTQKSKNAKVIDASKEKQKGDSVSVIARKPITVLIMIMITCLIRLGAPRPWEKSLPPHLQIQFAVNRQFNSLGVYMVQIH